jgi:hypothetical protein
VVQAAGRGVADVHRRAFADVLEIGEMLEVLGAVLDVAVVGGVAGLLFLFFFGHFLLLLGLPHAKAQRRKEERGEELGTPRNADTCLAFESC